MNLWHAVAYLNLVILAADHLTTGLAGVLFPQRATGLYQRLFGARFPADSPLTAILRPWGALGVFAGLTGLLPVYDVVRYRAILFPLLLLVVLRIFIRVSYDSATLQFFGLSRARNYFQRAVQRQDVATKEDVAVEVAFQRLHDRVAGAGELAGDLVGQLELGASH